MSNEDGLEELREQAQTGDRLDDDSGGEDSEQSLKDAFLDVLEAIEDDQTLKQVSARDETLAVLVRGLEQCENEGQDALDRLHDELGGRDNDFSRQEVVVSLALLGARDHLEEVIEALGDAKADHARDF